LENPATYGQKKQVALSTESATCSTNYNPMNIFFKLIWP